MGEGRDVLHRQSKFNLGLAVSALAAVEQPITVASAKTADVADPYF